jgi:serine/threonine-protein kinase
MRVMARVLGSRYALYEAFAWGGMGSVHFGRLLGDAGYARTVAIKHLHHHLALDAEFVTMFVDEARMATRIRHPNVVPTLDVVVADGEVFVVLEYVHGEPLEKLVKATAASDEQVPLDVVCAVASDLLHGLHAAHEAKDERGAPLGIVHRDVSPHNVIVGTDGLARVADFGVAMAVGRLGSTRKGQVKGKLGYMAPEHLLGHVIDRRVDVYAAAVVIWECIAATKLFAAATDTARAGQILYAPIEPPSHARSPDDEPGFDRLTLAAIDRIVMKGLARDPDERYKTAREMAEELAEVVPAAPRTRVGDWVERIAKDELEKRARLISSIETDPSVRTSPSGQAIVREVRSSGSLSFESAPSGRGDPEVPKSRVPGMSLATVIETPRRRAWLRSRRVVGASLAVAVAAGAAAWEGMRGRARSQPAGASGADGGPADGSRAGRAITDWPEPQTESKQAAAEYRAALQAIRNNARGDARQHLRKAVEADPTLAAAHLRLSVYSRVIAVDTERRLSFTRALQNKNRLGERDGAILDAFEPRLAHEPPDTKGTVARLTALAVRSPDDAEIAYLLGATELDAGAFERARAALERATELDSVFADAWADLTTVLLYLGRFDPAVAAADRCIAISPLATGCVTLRAEVHSDAGQCAAYEEDARQLLAADPESPQGYTLLAVALAGQDRPLDLVRSALDERGRRLSAVDRPRELRLGGVGLPALAGDFTRAEALVEEIQRLRASDNELESHSDPARLLVQIREEAGRTAAAREAAERFLERYPILVPSADVDVAGMASDVYPWMLGALRRVKAISSAELDAKRAAWLTKWRARAPTDYVPFLWLFAYAMAVTDREDATLALAKLPEFSPAHGGALPRIYMGRAGIHIGRVYLLAGRPAEAIAPLDSAAHSCEALLEPFDHTHSILALATALEQTGDIDRACAAYARVLQRWGHAKPRSVSADEAKLRWSALRCR